MASITNFNQMAAEQQRTLTDQLRMQKMFRTLKYAPANDNRPQANNATPLGGNLSQACASERGAGAFPPGFGLA